MFTDTKYSTILSRQQNKAAQIVCTDFAFKIINGDESVTPTYQEIRCQMIFDVKMEDFHRKETFVTGGHTTNTQHAMTYESVV
jgi:hypothetical protein